MSDTKESTRTVYLGETVVGQHETPFQGFGRGQWALHYIGQYGQIDGAHHKAWVLDRVARILNGAPIEVKLAKWSDGTQEYRTSVGSCPEHETWVAAQKDGYDGPETYGYEEGIAP